MTGVADSGAAVSLANTAVPVLAKPAIPRIHYLDNLRAGAMLLGVLLHAGMAYADQTQSFWLATDPGSSVAIDVAISFVHLFRMSLFFLLSGYFAALLIKRKGVWAFLKNRLVRIVAPFLLFYPFLFGAMFLLIVFGWSYVPEPRGLMGLIADAARQAEPRESSRPPGTMHLWFLYYLMLFSLIAALLSRFRIALLDRLFRTCPKRGQTLSGDRLQRVRPLFGQVLFRPQLVWFLPLALMPGVLASGVPVPAPESFLPQWWPLATYGLFYWAGWRLFGREDWLAAQDQCRWPLLAISGVLFAIYWQYQPRFDLAAVVANRVDVATGNYLIACLLTAYLSAILTLAALLWGKRLLEKQRPWLRFLSDASYWTYLIHLPIVIFLQTLFIPLPVGVWIKLFATTTGTLLFCLATYLVFVRYTPIGWLLNGKRPFP